VEHRRSPYYLGAWALRAGRVLVPSAALVFAVAVEVLRAEPAVDVAPDTTTAVAPVQPAGVIERADPRSLAELSADQDQDAPSEQRVKATPAKRAATPRRASKPSPAPEEEPMSAAEKASTTITLSLAAATEIAPPAVDPRHIAPSALGKNVARPSKSALAARPRAKTTASLQDQATKLPVVTDILWFGGLPIYRKDGAERNVGVAVQPLWPLGVGFRGKFH
jgi:hypothetical protein